MLIRSILWLWTPETSIVMSRTRQTSCNGALPARATKMGAPASAGRLAEVMVSGRLEDGKSGMRGKRLSVVVAAPAESGKGWRTNGGRRAGAGLLKTRSEMWRKRTGVV